MSLQFIIGGSGSGKTRRLYNDLIEQAAGDPLFCYRTGTVYHADTERYCNAASLSWRYEY